MFSHTFGRFYLWLFHFRFRVRSIITASLTPFNVLLFLFYPTEPEGGFVFSYLVANPVKLCENVNSLLISVQKKMFKGMTDGRTAGYFRCPPSLRPQCGGQREQNYCCPPRGSTGKYILVFPHFNRINGFLMKPL